jgi:spore maturation protein CgeB
MSYKFLKVTSYYKGFIDNFFFNNSELMIRPSGEQLTSILDKEFGWGNYFQINLNKLGNEAYEIVYNADSIQNMWAKENNVNATTREDIFLGQIKSIRPDILFIQDNTAFKASFVSTIRRECPFIKKIIGWICAPFSEDNKRLLSLCDFVFSCSNYFQSLLTKDGIKNYRLDHAFESSMLERIHKNNSFPSSNFLFVGSFFPGSEYHDMRAKIIEKLFEESIDVTIYTQLKKDRKLFIKQVVYLLHKALKKIKLESIVENFEAGRKVAQLNEFPRDLKFSKHFWNSINNTPLFGIDMLKALSKAKIVLNSHGGIAGDFACNIRLFEATGAGACLLTDHKKNISDFFIPDSEVVTYKSISECVEKTKWLLAHPEEARKIALAGQKRTLQDHTFYNRAVELDSIIKKELSN